MKINNVSSKPSFGGYIEILEQTTKRVGPEIISTSAPVRDFRTGTTVDDYIKQFLTKIFLVNSKRINPKNPSELTFKSSDASFISLKRLFLSAKQEILPFDNGDLSLTLKGNDYACITQQSEDGKLVQVKFHFNA